MPAPPLPPAPDGDEAPDRWAEADAAWERKWSDAPDAAPPDDALPPPPAAYQPAAPTTASVTDAYGDGMRAAGPYLGLGMQVAASMLFFVGLGYLADRMLGTRPWGMVLGAAVGLVGVLALLVRVAREADARR